MLVAQHDYQKLCNVCVGVILIASFSLYLKLKSLHALNETSELDIGHDRKLQHDAAMLMRSIKRVREYISSENGRS